MTPYDQKTQEVIAEIRNYNVSINREQKLELFTDGLCENPGAMHIGLFARQGNNCLFTRHTFAGHGTCNEAEYIAVKTGLTVLQALYPEPGVPVVVFLAPWLASLPADDPRQRRPDISLAREHLDWQPRIPLAEGLKPTIVGQTAQLTFHLVTGSFAASQPQTPAPGTIAVP